MAFIFGLVEYGRLQLVSNMLMSACRTSARLGATEGVASADAEAKVREMLSSVVDPNQVDVLVKNAGVYDTDSPLPDSADDYGDLPNLELRDAEARQLFLVRATVQYNDIAIFPFSILDGVSLSGMAFMRHE